jgi:hypothetical protein
MNRNEQARGPDFLIVGAPRTGTSWLYAVLRKHPSLWLAPVKELHYFDKPARTRTWFDPYEWRRARPTKLDPWYVSYLLGKRSDKWYAKLFAKAQRKGLIAGEATPDYAVLTMDVFQRIERMNPGIKLILVMRDPVDRSWSAVNNAFKKGRADRSDVNAAIQWARLKGPRARSTYSESIERLEKVFPRDQLHYCFFDDLVSRPMPFVDSVLSFLGANSIDPKLLPSAAINAVAKGRPVPFEFAREMAKDFLPSVCDLCERFDGPPQNWRARYEDLLRRELQEATGAVKVVPSLTSYR